MESATTIWSSALSNIAETVSAEQFKTWFDGVSLASVSPEQAVIRVPNAFYSKWFEMHYEGLIAGALRSSLGARPRVSFEIAPQELQPRPAPTDISPPASPVSPTRTASSRPKLNRDYVFSKFVVGPSNQLAHAASMAVVESPGHSYNPLFLHAGVGLGKTHLVHAVAHALLKKRPELRVKYMACESFMNQFLYALQKGGLEQFRRRSRQVDALMIDDIHVLARRTRTQEEFFHTFNELYNSHKQIIVCSDSAPENIPTFEERLISRFKWGLVARIDPPCLETRMAIVRKKAEQRGKILHDDVVEFIADVTPTNVRELEGAVLKTIGYASLMNRPADITLAAEILRHDKSRTSAGQITCDRIQDIVGEWFDVTPAQFQAKTRTRSIAFPRQIAMYLTRNLTNKSLEEIGRAFGGRDHSTVAYAHRHITEKTTADPDILSTIDTLTQKIKSDRPTSV